MSLAARNIETFHNQTLPARYRGHPLPRPQRRQAMARRSTAPGSTSPAARRPLFSTLLMLAIPARVAGVERLTVVTPPRPDGGLDPADRAGRRTARDRRRSGPSAARRRLPRWRSARATSRAVDRICGPGNAWVAAAKALVSSLPGGPGIDLPAGPSELMIIADDSADPATVAADLLSQAEHDPEAQVLLVSPSRALIDAVERAKSARQSRRSTPPSPRPARSAAPTSTEAVAIANAYAPEHLSLATDRAAELVPRDPQRRGDLRRPPGGGELRRLSRRIEPRPADRRRRALHRRRVDDDLHEGDHRPADHAAAAASLAAPAAALARLEGLEAHARAAEARHDARMSLAKRLARPEILALPPCDIAGAPLPGTIRLDANENPFAPLVSGPAGDQSLPRAAARRAAPAARRPLRRRARLACGWRAAATTPSTC